MKRLKTQLLLLIVVSIGIFSAVMIFFFAFQYFYANKKWNDYKDSINNHIIASTEEKLRSLMRILLTTCESKINDISIIASENAKIFEDSFGLILKADLNGLAEQNVVVTDQVTQKPQNIKFKFWNKLADTLKFGTDKTYYVSFLQRLNESGDFVRFATNRTNLAKSSAVGTYLPSLTKLGKANNVTNALLKGNNIWATEVFLEDRFFTYYRPVFSSTTNECIGAIEIAFPQKILITAINTIIENFFDGEVIDLHVFDSSEYNFGEPITTLGKDFGSFDVTKWLDAKNRPFLIDIFKELKMSKFYQNDEFGILTNLGKTVEILTNGEKNATKFIFRAAVIKSINWFLVLSINCSKIQKNTNQTNDNLFNINELFKKFGAIILIVTFLLFLALIKFANKRLSSLEFFWLKLQKTLQLILNKDIKLESYEERIVNEHQLAQIVKTCSDVNSSLRDHFIESRNIAQDMFHTVDAMIENFKSSERLYALLSKTHENVVSDLDDAYSKLRKAEDSAVILSKSLAKINELEPSIEVKYNSIIEIQTKGTKHLSEIETELDESIKVLNNFISATNNISNTKELLLSLSEQTNLLALNATIEASNENISSGKGFSIVAEEVKELANKTTSSMKVIDNEVSMLKKSSKIFTSKVTTIKEKSTESSLIFTQLIEANEAQHKLMQEWMIQVFQWGDVITPLVSIIKGFIISIESSYREIEKSVSHLDHNKQYLNAINNDTTDVKRLLNDLNSVILGWDIES